MQRSSVWTKLQDGDKLTVRDCTLKLGDWFPTTQHLLTFNHLPKTFTGC